MALSLPCHVGLLGLGRFGAAFLGLVRANGFTATAYDPRHPETSARTLEDVVRAADILVLAVPVEHLDTTLASVAPLLRPGQLVIDVCSVKALPEARLRAHLEGKARWVASHPLFGPVSLARGEPRTVVVCPRAEAPDDSDDSDDAKRFFTALGCEVVEVSASEHDRVMSRTHVLAFFVARALQDIGAATAPFAPPSFKSMAHVVSLVREDAGHLFTAIQTGNPFAKEARRELIAALQRIDDEIG